MSLKKLDPVVVGYDGSPGSRAALRWAVAEAVRNLSPLRVVEVSEPGPIGSACRPIAGGVPWPGSMQMSGGGEATITGRVSRPDT